MIQKSLFSAIHTSASGLSVQRTRMNTVSENLANIDTTRTEDGSPYRRKIVQVSHGGAGVTETFSEVLKKSRLDLVETNDRHRPNQPRKEVIVEQNHYGVQVAQVVDDPSDFRLVYDPAHPDANAEGFVQMPNINPVKEMIELITASRSYEANVTALTSAKEMIKQAIRI